MASATTTTLQYGPLLTGLGGGLALFLYGMTKMTEALRIVAGDGMKNALARRVARLVLDAWEAGREPARPEAPAAEDPSITTTRAVSDDD